MFCLTLTYFSQGGHKNPECDDEGNLNTVELDMKNFVVMNLVMPVTIVTLLGS